MDIAGYFRGCQAKFTVINVIFGRNGEKLATYRVIGYTFKSTKKLNYCKLGSLNKPKTPGHCGFALANVHSAKSVDFVPTSNRYN